jgi:hypothetical protein
LIIIDINMNILDMVLPSNQRCLHFAEVRGLLRFIILLCFVVPMLKQI